MNITQFRATRRHVADLVKDAGIPPEYFERAQPGFVYDGDTYIEDNGDALHLLIGRDEWIAPRADLAALELRLYAWVAGEFFENAEDGRAADIACAFADVLGVWLSEEEFAEMRQRNAAQEDPNVCHSHDFCDANMAMEEAWRRAFGFGPLDDGQRDAAGGMSQENCALWNRAWELAAPMLGKKA